MGSRLLRSTVRAVARSGLVLPALALLGCGGVATEREAPDAGATNGDAAGGAEGDGGASGRTPNQHRPSSASCTPSPLPPEPEIPDAGLSPSASFECHVHADCTAHPRGRCLFFPTNPPVDPGGTRCVYECLTDTDCATASACTCGTPVSTCLPGDCRIDDECGSGGFCSPSLDGCGTGTMGYFCHTTADTCLDDRDCDPQTLERCIFDNVGSKHWACSPVGCQ